jgi:hypothetical protein
MGCAPSTPTGAQYAATAEEAAGTPYYKLVSTPGGRVIRVKGYMIDARLPTATPGGTAVVRLKLAPPVALRWRAAV